MIKDTLSKLEATIKRVESVDSKHKKELLALLNKLKTEVAALPHSHAAQANSIANFAQAAAHEAICDGSDARMRELSREGLLYAAKKFEVSHPVLVGVVNDICRMLAQIGI
ncbi:MAG TPA: DUF4404 family protein [Elusimicrobiales bacterium]|nr:DUF4404 family protein [Elusimicrobiales bacterium]